MQLQDSMDAVSAKVTELENKIDTMSTRLTELSAKLDHKGGQQETELSHAASSGAGSFEVESGAPARG